MTTVINDNDISLMSPYFQLGPLLEVPFAYPCTPRAVIKPAQNLV